jgi:hypothetical protein
MPLRYIISNVMHTNKIKMVLNSIFLTINVLLYFLIKIQYFQENSISKHNPKKKLAILIAIGL